MSDAFETQKRYTLLANQLAGLSEEAAALEGDMCDGKFYPMTVQVYNALREAHEGCLFSINTLSKETGIVPEVVEYKS